jgi:hypothetical protein
MAVGRPILVYGPPDVAQVEYARSKGWGLVVDQRDSARLREAVGKLFHDADLRAGLAKSACSTVEAHHDSAAVRRVFQETLAVLGSNGSGVVSRTRGQGVQGAAQFRGETR